MFTVHQQRSHRRGLHITPGDESNLMEVTAMHRIASYFGVSVLTIVMGAGSTLISTVNRVERETRELGSTICFTLTATTEVSNNPGLCWDQIVYP
jgi:hypothetical protein